MAKQEAGKTRRGVTFRLLLGSEEREHLLHGICRAYREVWNFFLGKNQKQYAESKEKGAPAPPRHGVRSSESSQSCAIAQSMHGCGSTPVRVSTIP